MLARGEKGQNEREENLQNKQGRLVSLKGRGDKQQNERGGATWKGGEER